MSYRVNLPGSPLRLRRPPSRPGPGALRKVGILGGHPASLRQAPWDDPTWEWWSHASTVRMLRVEPHRLIDIHPPHCFTTQKKNGFADYYEFLRRTHIPIYMQRVVPEIPTSVKYPRDIIKSLWPGVPFGSQTAWMVALALLEGVTHLGFWGVSYEHKTEYSRQRANAEHWVGIARGSGVQIVLPKSTPFCREPVEDYGYQSHDTAEKTQALKDEVIAARNNDGPVGPKFDPSRLIPVETVEGLEVARQLRREKDPNWARAEDEGQFGEVVPRVILDQEAMERAEFRLRLADTATVPVDGQ